MNSNKGNIYKDNIISEIFQRNNLLSANLNKLTSSNLESVKLFNSKNNVSDIVRGKIKIL